jgi:hypothetical protein
LGKQNQEREEESSDRDVFIPSTWYPDETVKTSIEHRRPEDQDIMHDEEEVSAGERENINEEREVSGDEQVVPETPPRYQGGRLRSRECQSTSAEKTVGTGTSQGGDEISTQFISETPPRKRARSEMDESWDYHATQVTMSPTPFSRARPVFRSPSYPSPPHRLSRQIQSVRSSGGTLPYILRFESNFIAGGK